MSQPNPGHEDVQYTGAAGRWGNTADLPGKVLNANSVFGVCKSTTHFHFELWVKQQHKVDVAIVSVHIHQEGVFHHQPAS